MLSIEQYAALYLSMTTATGNAQQEESICQVNGITIAQWQEAKAYYTAKMMDPMDMGKTALAFSAALQNGTKTTSQQSSVPCDFVANKISIYISEYDVQMVEFLNTHNKQHIVLQLGFEATDDFEKNYINGRVHISINDQSYSIYGGVSKVELSSNKVIFIFDEEGKERMKCDSVTVNYDIDGKFYNYLKRKMRFMYSTILEIKNEPMANEYTVNGITIKDDWATFESRNTKIAIRPYLENAKTSGKYPGVVFIDYMSNTIGQDANESALINEMEACLIDSIEKDLAALVTFHVTYPEKRRYFIYTFLGQSDFMARINDAFKLLPKLPLQFSGGADGNWENYTNCFNDYNNK